MATTLPLERSSCSPSTPWTRKAFKPKLYFPNPPKLLNLQHNSKPTQKGKTK
jgi:hypothetical protein